MYEYIVYLFIDTQQKIFLKYIKGNIYKIKYSEYVYCVYTGKIKY